MVRFVAFFVISLAASFSFAAGGGTINFEATVERISGVTNSLPQEMEPGAMISGQINRGFCCGKTRIAI